MDQVLIKSKGKKGEDEGKEGPENETPEGDANANPDANAEDEKDADSAGMKAQAKRQKDDYLRKLRLFEKIRVQSFPVFATVTL